VNTEHVQFIPKALSEGVLYVSKDFELATHLCACGCKLEVVTPIDAGGWTLSENEQGATLSPSIGNMKTCGSHYWIRDGKVVHI